MLKNNRLNIIILLFLFSFFSACEKDDICSTETQKTPLVKIVFQEDMGDNEKSVPFLQVGFEGSITVPSVEDGEIVPTPILLPVDPANATEINLPLDTRSNRTTLYLIKNSGVLDDEMKPTQDIDTLELVYSREYDYISRACGYKVTFEGLVAPQEQIVWDREDTWIKKVFVEKSTIENSEETHIIISH